MASKAAQPPLTGIGDVYSTHTHTPTLSSLPCLANWWPLCLTYITEWCFILSEVNPKIIPKSQKAQKQILLHSHRPAWMCCIVTFFVISKVPVCEMFLLFVECVGSLWLWIQVWGIKFGAERTLYSNTITSHNRRWPWHKMLQKLNEDLKFHTRYVFIAGFCTETAF